MKKLKLMALIMVAIMTFSLAGCSDSSYGGGNNFQGGNSFINSGGNNLQGGNGFINSGSNNTNSDSGNVDTVKPTKSVKSGIYTFYNEESGLCSTVRFCYTRLTSTMVRISSFT